MGIVVTTLDTAAIPQVRMACRLYLNAAKTKVVAPGDPEAAFLYCVPGTLVPREEAIRLGAIQPVLPPDPVVEPPKPTPKMKKMPVPNEEVLGNQ